MLARRVLLPMLGLVLWTPTVAAQTTYARTGRDTLRYREVTTTNAKLTTPQGELPITITHDATIAVLLLPGDSARAWYEALKLGMSSPEGSNSPETGPVLRQPFVLGFDPKGNIKVITTPAFPASFQGVSDLTYQFSDFFLRLPTSPLNLGLAWTDSTTRTTRNDEKSSTVKSVASYRVERDTTVAGQPAFVISMKQQLRSENEGPIPGQPARAHSIMTGTDDGIFVFSKSGEMLGRRRTGTLRGGMTLSAQGQSMEIPQEYTYTNTVDRIR